MAEGTKRGEVTLRSVLIARGSQVRVYGSVDAVPDEERGRVERVLRNHEVLTVVIADRKGLEKGREMVSGGEMEPARAVEGGPDGGVMQAMALCGVAALVVWAIATLL